MQNRRLVVKLLLCLHLFVFVVWLYLFHADMAPIWMIHVVVLSLLGIQFTWGLTVGLMIGPSRKRRHLLWFSLLPIFLPCWVLGALVRALAEEGPLVALLYLGLISAILACETFGGVLIGARLHSQSEEN